MYNFRDVTDRQEVLTKKPSEAISLDGTYLDETVPGYTTISVSGRESLEYEITEESRPVGVDGMDYFGKRQEGRTLTVRFSLFAKTAEEFIKRYRMLKNACKGEGRIIRFDDEPNAHYIGTLMAIEEPDPGRLNVIGEMVFYCADPYLVSDMVTTVTAVQEYGKLVAHIDNDGSGEVYPIYRVKNVAENGYIGIVHPSGAFEMGNIEEADGEDYQEGERLFITNDGDFSGWEPYTGTHPQNSKIACNGALKIEDCHPTSHDKPAYKAFAIDSPGTQQPNMEAYGGCRRITLPADSNGEVGAKNFYLWFKMQYVTGKMGQTGYNQITLADENNQLIAAFTTSKVDTSGNTAYARMLVGDGKGGYKIFKTFNFWPVNWDDNIYWGRGCEDILKIGSTIQFYFNGAYYKVDVPALADKKVKYVYTFIGVPNGTRDKTTVMKVGMIHGTKLNVDKWRNLPNRYPQGSVAVINCEEDTVTLDGMPKNDEVIDGSAFYSLPPGKTDVEFYASGWCKTPPEVIVEFRKRWL